ncbi:hypothetical protein C7402_1358 [Paraburkholderia unamae]|uniref:Uncharacterized protein n=1 Tax=Paraburkholderia unamae TaxID=219649 RepID=A0ABX5KAX0_9BURK|nr:hypothetical protein C7402_1358 [Paraburkholderia unamae]
MTRLSSSFRAFASGHDADTLHLKAAPPLIAGSRQWAGALRPTNSIYS